MKLFIVVVFAAIIIGGFVGAELMDSSFSATGAVVGGVGTAAVLLGLGAFFDAQERKREEKALPSEMRAVFDRMLTGTLNSQASNPVAPKTESPKKQVASQEDDLLSIEGAIKSLIERDSESIARGEMPERRLIPHHAIKRDVIIAAYNKDYQTIVSQIRVMNCMEVEKQRSLSEIKKDFDKQIFGIKNMAWEDLDKIIALMKKTRTDLEEIENSIRSKNPIYKIVDPL